MPVGRNPFSRGQQQAQYSRVPTDLDDSDDHTHSIAPNGSGGAVVHGTNRNVDGRSGQAERGEVVVVPQPRRGPGHEVRGQDSSSLASVVGRCTVKTEHEKERAS